MLTSRDWYLFPVEPMVHTAFPLNIFHPSRASMPLRNKRILYSIGTPLRTYFSVEPLSLEFS